MPQTPPRSILVSLVTVQCLLGGCAAPATYRFRVVDARTNLPVVGAGVHQSSLKRSLFTRYTDALREVPRPPTGDDGTAVVPDVDDRNWIQAFTFSKDGYEPAKVKNTFTSDDEMQVVVYSPAADVMAARIVDPKQVIVVPLLPAAAATQPASRRGDVP